MEYELLVVVNQHSQNSDGWQEYPIPLDVTYHHFLVSWWHRDVQKSEQAFLVFHRSNFDNDRQSIDDFVSARIDAVLFVLEQQSQKLDQVCFHIWVQANCNQNVFQKLIDVGGCGRIRLNLITLACWFKKLLLN